MKPIAKAAAALVLAAAVSSPAAAAGTACKASFTSNGNMHLTKYGALKSAREVWQAQVRAQYGAEYATWTKPRPRAPPARRPTCSPTSPVRSLRGPASKGHRT